MQAIRGFDSDGESEDCFIVRDDVGGAQTAGFRRVRQSFGRRVRLRRTLLPEKEAAIHEQGAATFNSMVAVQRQRTGENSMRSFLPSLLVLLRGAPKSGPGKKRKKTGSETESTCAGDDDASLVSISAASKSDSYANRGRGTHFSKEEFDSGDNLLLEVIN